MNKKQKTRLETLAAFLDILDPKAFSYGRYWKIPEGKLERVWKKNADIKRVNKKLKNIFKRGTKHNCGTAACAYGYLPVVFPRYWDYVESADYIKYYDSSICCQDIEPNPINQTSRLYAVERFFGISELDKDVIFYGREHHSVKGLHRLRLRNSKVHPKTIAKRIRKLIKHYEKEGGIND